MDVLDAAISWFAGKAKKIKKKSKNIYKKIFPEYSEYCRILRRVKAQPF